jgi:hypothetical protein
VTAHAVGGLRRTLFGGIDQRRRVSEVDGVAMGNNGGRKYLHRASDSECGRGMAASAHGSNWRMPWRAHGRSMAMRQRSRSESAVTSHP